MDEAQRLHDALCTATEQLAAVMEGASFEQRKGYALVSFPTFPLPSFNGVWPAEESAADALEDALVELEHTEVALGVMARSGRTPSVDDAARRLGLTAEARIPGMVARQEDLRDAAVPDLEVLRLETADGFAESLAVAAAGFEIPAEVLSPVYAPEVTSLEGLSVYLARVDGQDVATAVGFVMEDAVGIYNVATPPEHRRRGYGGAITAHAVREGLAMGGEFAYLQSSTMGKSVYAGLGFREVETYVLFTRGPEVSQTS